MQKAIDYSLIDEFDRTVNFIDLRLVRFPYPPYSDDKFVVVIIAVLPFIIMLSFVFTVILTAKAIVTEKETGAFFNYHLNQEQKKNSSLDGFEPSTFRLTAERANQLRHRDFL